MLYVVAELDVRDATLYRWLIYDDADPTKSTRRAEYPYPTRAAALDAGWAIVASMEERRRTG